MGARRTFKVADLGLSTQVAHVLRSMLAVVQGRSEASWQVSRPQDADVLFVGSDDELLRTGADTTRVLIAVSSDAASRSRSMTAFALHYPFRVMQLLTLLDSVARHLQNTPVPNAVASPGWASALSLRDGRRRVASEGLLVAPTSDGGHLWLDGRHGYAAPATMALLRSGPVGIGSFASTGQPIPEAVEHGVSADMAWFVGVNGPADLPPWLDAARYYGLRHWPDLGRLRESAWVVDVCAQASMRADTPAELSRRSGMPIGHVHRFLAAASLAGCLSGYESAVASAVTTGPAVPRGWRHVLSQLRKRLS